jgi:Nucleotidyl transferase AbiEii toxin, Type IV TA system
MTEVKFRYETPSAFRSALKDRFGQIARTDRRYSVDELQRQFGYDRALARLFSSDDADRWVLKGAGALLARLTTARHSKDVDMFFDATNADVGDAVDALQAALRVDLGDHFGLTSPGSRHSRRRPREPVCMSAHDSVRRLSRPSI